MISPDGLNLTDPESWTTQEEDAFRSWYRDVKGETMPGHDFWIEHRPDVLKRYRLQIAQNHALLAGGEHDRKIGPLAYLHYYAIVGFEDGIRYQIANASRRGRATKAEILATLAVAFFHAGPLGMRFVASGSEEHFTTFEDPVEPSGWPDGWATDAHAFAVGMDYSNPELEPSELKALLGWYEERCGEVPAHLRFMSTHMPTVLKAFWHRLEFAVKDHLPVQMVPLLQLQWEVTRGFGPGIRDAALLARGLGVQKAFAIDAIVRAFVYCGPAGLSLVEASASDVLADEAWM